jgi:hypothetical protein
MFPTRSRAFAPPSPSLTEAVARRSSPSHPCPQAEDNYCVRRRT